MNKGIAIISIFALSTLFMVLNISYSENGTNSLISEVKAYNFPILGDKANVAQEARLMPVWPNKVVSNVDFSVNDNQFSLHIPNLGVTAPIIFESSTDFNHIYKSLERGVVHYAKTPRPNESGVSIILGHSSYPRSYTGSYGKVFDSLDRIKQGDIIQVIDKNGAISNYRVSKSLIFAPDDYDNSELLDLEETNSSSLVLMSCWPVGTADKRIAIKADII